MKTQPIFSDKLSLQQEIKFLHQNALSAVTAYFLCCCIGAFTVYLGSGSADILYWLMVSGLVSAFIIIYATIYPFDKVEYPRGEAIKTTAFAFILGSNWAYLPLHYMEENSVALTIGLTVLVCGITAGATILQSTSIPIFAGFVYPCLLAQALSFYLMDDLMYKGLAVAFVLYLVVLSSFAKKLRLTNQQLRTLQTSNSQLIEELKVALHIAEEANRTKSMFLASASHDLRQPVHAIGLFTETLQKTELNTKQKMISDHLKSSFNSAREMLNVLLDFSKLDAGVIKADQKSFLVQTIFRTLEDDLAPSAHAKNLIYRTRETALAAYSDPALVTLVLRNLIDNAIHYTETGGLLVACRVKPNDILSLEVWDTGIGISEDNQNIVFQEFTQIGNPERDSTKGLGLGLANAMGIAKILQAQLSVRSRLGRGSLFSLRIPMSNDPVVEDISEENIDSRFAGKNILFIDDDQAIRVGLRNLLESWECNCMVAESGDEALLYFSDQPVDLLIVDYRLRNNVTGKEVIEQIREHFSENLPTIILTGDTASDRIREANAIDAFLLHKPASSSQLYMAMSEALS